MTVTMFSDEKIIIPGMEHTLANRFRTTKAPESEETTISFLEPRRNYEKKIFMRG